MDQTWFEFSDLRTKKLSTGVWIPLRQSQASNLTQDGGEKVEEYSGLRTLMIPIRFKARAERMRWDSISLDYSGPIVERNRYSPTGIHPSRFEAPWGMDLVLEQGIPGESYPVWHLDQDLVFALGLMREGDIWVRPSENYRDAVRLKRKEDGKPFLIEIRQEFLRDYLCARGMGLVMLSFQERSEIRREIADIDWDGGSEGSEFSGGRWSGHVTEIDAMGMPLGTVSVFHIRRSNTDSSDDDPQVSHTDEMHTEQTSFTRRRASYRVCGQLWKSDWVNPGELSVRVRQDDEPSINFVVGASGGLLASTDLESGGRWIWFRPEVIPALSKRRGGSLDWYSRETGAVVCSPGSRVVFGLNELGLVTVYAKDIARLPNWQQRIWAGFNVSPEGGLGSELYTIQVIGDYVRTTAPEKLLCMALDEVSLNFLARTGHKLFREHSIQQSLRDNLSRFTGSDWPGLQALAKDVARLTADSINTEVLRIVVAEPGSLASLKLLEKFLGSLIPIEQARELIAPLFCVYDLRLGDAHLPASNLETRLEDMGIDRSRPFVWQSAQLLHISAAALHKMAEAFKSAN